MIKEALQYITDLKAQAEQTRVLEICGKTYANRKLVRYGEEEKASPLKVSTLSALLDYIKSRGMEEFKGGMILHIKSPEEVALISGLNAERERETLILAEAEVSGFRFGSWYDQERFIIELQANFEETEDLKKVKKCSGNMEAKTTAKYGDDGVSQKVTVNKGIATLEEEKVPNPVYLVPYRTFSEVEQPGGNFVFRVRENGAPEFCLVEAGNGLWKIDAIANIRQHLQAEIDKMPEELRGKLSIIG